MIKLSIKFDEKAAKALLKKEADRLLRLEAHAIVEELRAATPVRTGRARDGWSWLQLKNGNIVIVNEVEYIAALNAGTSRQAAAHFIESILLAHGKASGSVLAYK